MIGVAIVDDHYAVRLGLHTAIRSEPGLGVVGPASRAAELSSLLARTHPDGQELYASPGQLGQGVFAHRLGSDVS